MSVKLTYRDGSTKDYNPRLPVETQLKDIKLVSIRWNVDDASIGMFLTDLSRAMEFKVIEPFEFRVDHEDSIVGAKAKNKAKELEDKMTFAWLVKEVVNFQNHIDKSLEDLSTQIKASTEK